MIIALIVLYLLVGLVVGSFVAWDAAKDEAQRVDPQPVAPLAVGLSVVVTWPIVLLFMAIATAGAALIERAGRSS